MPVERSPIIQGQDTERPSSADESVASRTRSGASFRRDNSQSHRHLSRNRSAGRSDLNSSCPVPRGDFNYQRERVEFSIPAAATRSVSDPRIQGNNEYERQSFVNSVPFASSRHGQYFTAAQMNQTNAAREHMAGTSGMNQGPNFHTLPVAGYIPPCAQIDICPYPTFSGKVGENPMEFISKLEKCFAQRGTPLQYKSDKLYEAVTDRAQLWCRMMMRRCESYEQLKVEFIQQFWGPEVQREIKLEIVSGHYKGSSELSMSDYLLQMYDKSQQLQPPMPESEFLAEILFHFPPHIARDITSARCRTVIDMYSLLQNFERIDHRRNANFQRYTPVSNSQAPTSFKRNKDNVDRANHMSRENRNLNTNLVGVDEQIEGTDSHDLGNE